MNKEQLQKEIHDEFEVWYAKMLPVFPDIAPYKEILFLAFVAGAIHSSEITNHQLEVLLKAIT